MQLSYHKFDLRINLLGIRNIKYLMFKYLTIMLITLLNHKTYFLKIYDLHLFKNMFRKRSELILLFLNNFLCNIQSFAIILLTSKLHWKSWINKKKKKNTSKSITEVSGIYWLWFSYCLLFSLFFSLLQNFFPTHFKTFQGYPKSRSLFFPNVEKCYIYGKVIFLCC